MPPLRPYTADLPYSYAAGLFPSLQLMAAAPERAQRLLLSERAQGEGVDKLLEMIGERLDSGSRRCVLHIPYDKGGLLDQLYREAKVENVEYGETIAVTAVCTPKVLGQMAPFLVE